MKKKKPEKTDIPEKLRYSRYYEHDGALRAYATIRQDVESPVVLEIVFDVDVRATLVL